MGRTPLKEETIAYYEQLLEDHGDSFRALDWKDEKLQQLRFAVLMYITALTHRVSDISILDLGCGLGHLYGFLKKEDFIEKYNIDYTGLDISSKMIDVAKKKFPEAKFEVRDILEEISPQQYDYVISSGMLNTRLGENPFHLDFVRLMLSKAYEVCRLGVAFNFLSIFAKEHTVETDKNRYYFYEPGEILNFAQKIAPRFTLRHDYYPSDFTVYLLKGWGGIKNAHTG